MYHNIVIGSENSDMDLFRARRSATTQGMSLGLVTKNK
jgi:hypothetical protein